MMKQEYSEANVKLYSKGYILCNMVCDSESYELCDRENGEVVIDHLSMAQVIALSNLL